MSNDSDKAAAAQIRHELTELLAPVLQRMDKAVMDGYDVSFQLGNVGGRMAVSNITVSKRL